MANDKGRAIRRAARNATSVVEERAMPLSEVRFAADEGGHRFEGTAAVFNQPAMIGAAPWGFRETIDPGAFNRTLANGDPVLLADHDPAKPLARKSAGTLRLAALNTGLDVDADLPNTTYGADLIENLRVRNVKGMSFGFRVVDDVWTTGDDGVEERLIREVELIEVSTTAFPAYTGTTAGLRQMQEMCEAVRSSRQQPAQRAQTGLDTGDGDDDLLPNVPEPDDEGDEGDGTFTCPNCGAEIAVPASQRSTRGPADATRDISDANGSAGATRSEVASLRLRHQAFAARFGLPPATTEGITQ